jgi:hypothetical protein
MKTCPRRPWLRGLAVVALLLGTCLPAAGQTWVTALSEQGRISINGKFVEKLRSSFKTKTTKFLFAKTKTVVNSRQRWWELTVDGTERYAIRQDGRVSKNGVRIHELNFGGLANNRWVGLAVAESGLWMLRDDGRVSRDGILAAEFAAGGYRFRKIVSDGVHVYHLRTDGAIFRDDIPGAFYRLKGGGKDGDSTMRTWRTLAIDDTADLLFALRADGKVLSAALDGSSPFGGVFEANLPFEGTMTDAKAWVDISVRPDGRWLALRGRGAVRGPESSDGPIVNLPGTPDKKSSQRYMRIVALGGEQFAALRRDGRLYTGTSGSSLVNLRKGRYRALAVSHEPPDIATLRNQRPMVTRTSATLLEGTPIALPVQTVDVDMPVGQPQISVDPADLPAGARYDAQSRSILWDDPSPVGTYRIPLSVSDGQSKPVRTRLTLRVRPLDASPANRPPLVARMGLANALARQPFSLPILATDLDGDGLNVHIVDETLPQGASFDEASATLSWTPTDEQLGRHRLRFQVSDGSLIRTRTVTVRVSASLSAW